VLVGVLAGAVYFMVFRGENAPAAPTSVTTAATPLTPLTAAPAKSVSAAASDARIRLDLIQSAEESGAVGRKNLFQYRMAAPAPLPNPVATPPPTFTPPPAAPATSRGPVGPPPPPAITLRYTGFATTPGPSGKIYMAELFDSDRRYVASVGQYVLGKYRIVRITDTLVDIEDIEYSRQQSLPLVKNP
jgi:hypothetical protein